MTEPDEMSLVRYYNSIRLNYIDDIKVLIDNGSKNRAILSFKYDHLNFIINVMQILIILISSTVTLMESIKTYYNTENQAIDVAAILLTSFIGIIMTLYRFLKLENKKERTGNILESYNLILNKLQRVKNTMKNMVIKGDNTEEWAIISNSYTNETLSTYITIKESFDNNLSYKESLYYQNKYAKFFLQEKFLENELSTIINFNYMPHTAFKNKNICCCIKWRKFDYNKFIKLYDADNTRKYLKGREAQRTNQEIYFRLLNSRNIADYNMQFSKASGMPESEDSRCNSSNLKTQVVSPGIPTHVMSSCSISPSKLRNPRPVSLYNLDDNDRLKYVRPKTSKELTDNYSDSDIETNPPSPDNISISKFVDFPPPPTRPAPILSSQQSPSLPPTPPTPPSPKISEVDANTEIRNTPSPSLNLEINEYEPVTGPNKNSKNLKARRLKNGLVIFKV